MGGSGSRAVLFDLEELFDANACTIRGTQVGWRKAPHRVLRNKTVETWEAAGRPPSGARPGLVVDLARLMSMAFWSF